MTWEPGMYDPDYLHEQAGQVRATLAWLIERRNLDEELASELRLCIDDLEWGLGLAGPPPGEDED